jgi:hypothetical protein
MHQSHAEQGRKENVVQPGMVFEISGACGDARGEARLETAVSL